LLLQLSQGTVTLVATTEAEDQVEGALLLDVVVREGAPVLELLAGEDESLLVGGDALLVLDFGLDRLDRVGRLHLESDGLSSQGLHEDLHATTETEDQVEGGLFLNVVIGKSAPILELLPGEDQALLVGGDALLVLNLSLHRLDGVGRLHLEGDGLARKGLDEDLHATAEAEDQVEGALLLNVVVGEGTAVLELLAGEDEALLVGGDAFLVLNLRLH